MRKVISPCTCDVWYGRNQTKARRAFCKIEFDGKRLSISGVVGPKSNGDCWGSAGQCVDSIRRGKPVDGWTREMIDKFCDIWDRWHLNDMNPCCEHQRALGWKELAAEKITLYHYRLKNEAIKIKEAAEKAAIEALRKGETFTPSVVQQFFACLPSFLDTYCELKEDVAPYYEPKKSLYTGDKGGSETQFRGHVWYGKEEESTITKTLSEQGLLCKPCPVCGYEYGTSWLLEEVPQDVIDWLFSLPDTDITPAWV